MMGRDFPPALVGTVSDFIINERETDWFYSSGRQIPYSYSYINRDW